jgi:hypothetical protein
MAAGKFRKVLKRAIALAALAGLVAGTANAKTVVGSFDPDFGGIYTGQLSFQGNFSVYVPDGCLNPSLFASPGLYFVGDGNSCSTSGNANAFSPSAQGSWGGMSLLSATVTLKPASGPTQTLTYAVPDSTNPDYRAAAGFFTNDPVYGVVVEKDGSGAVNVVGVSTNLIGPQASNLGVGLPAGFYLQLGLGFNQGDIDGDNDIPPDNGEAAEITKLTTDQFGNFTSAYLFDAGSCNDGSLENNSLTCSVKSNPAAVTIPEPGSLALVLGAVAAGWIVRRQRRA